MTAANAISNSGLSTAKQRQDIGYLRKLLNLDDDLYYEMLLNIYGVSSSKKLTLCQAKEFLNKLRDIGRKMGVFKSTRIHSFQKYKYNNWGQRENMATPKQLRMIEALWFKVSRQTNDTDRKNALNSFIQRIIGVQNIRFLKKTDINKLKKAMENMGGK